MLIVTNIFIHLNKKGNTDLVIGTNDVMHADYLNTWFYSSMVEKFTREKHVNNVSKFDRYLGIRNTLK